MGDESRKENERRRSSGSSFLWIVDFFDYEIRTAGGSSAEAIVEAAHEQSGDGKKIEQSGFSPLFSRYPPQGEEENRRRRTAEDSGDGGEK
jgi:hypothetical protein